ncbi:MAG: heavy metal translocating P-type ATPase, partial [Steroidobacteraceae bacterium]
MKTSVIEVHAMLSVLSVDEVEKRIAEVPGVDSVTVNFASRHATVRYDETRLDVADIKSGVRLRGHEEAAPGSATEGQVRAASGAVLSATAAAPKPADAATPHPAPAATQAAAPAAKPAPESSTAGPKPDTAAMPAGMQMPYTAPKPAEPATPSLFQRFRLWLSPTAASVDPKTATQSPATAEHKGHAAHGGGSSPMSADMAQEMGHGGNMDLPAMVRDMRNRFWICLVFAVPIFIYSPMGNLFLAPAPPFGLPLNQWLFGLASAAVLYPSWPFFVAAWRALLNGKLNMATLIVLSVGTGYLFSVGAT